jgi:anti-anti-sigma regulatory factor
MWKIDRELDTKAGVLKLSGRIQGGDLAQLESLLGTESDQHVVLDLSGVKLVDQHVVVFFADRESAGVKLRNCPPYIREWINRL